MNYVGSEDAPRTLGIMHSQSSIEFVPGKLDVSGVYPSWRTLELYGSIQCSRVWIYEWHGEAMDAT